MSNLNPDQFFHGTRHNIADGMVRPADLADKPVSESSMGDPGDMSEGDHAFAIRNDENYAWHAALSFHNSGRRPRVYEVEPAKDMTPGPWNPQHRNFREHMELDPDEPIDPKEGQDEWASKTGFPVKQRLDIAPGHQGTFPQFNWNRFGAGGFHELNHPNDVQVRYGTLGHPQFRRGQEAPDNFGAVSQTPPRKRTGAALRAYMNGEPEPGPLHDHPKLF